MHCCHVGRGRVAVFSSMCGGGGSLGSIKTPKDDCSSCNDPYFPSLVVPQVSPAHAVLGGQVVSTHRTPAAVGVQLRLHTPLLELLQQQRGKGSGSSEGRQGVRKERQGMREAALPAASTSAPNLLHILSPPPPASHRSPSPSSKHIPVPLPTHLEKGVGGRTVAGASPAAGCPALHRGQVGAGRAARCWLSAHNSSIGLRCTNCRHWAAASPVGWSEAQGQRGRRLQRRCC
jgi:hypothetical protein